MKKNMSHSKRTQYKNDIIELILVDHKLLKKLIEVLKAEKPSFSKKRAAFEKFAPALLTHATAEEKTLYEAFKENDDMRLEALEGDAEHAIAHQLVDEISSIRGDEEEFMAKAKVLAELVEHHIEEEEGEVFKQVRIEFSVEERVQIGNDYSELMNHGRPGQYKKEKARDRSPIYESLSN